MAHRAYISSLARQALLTTLWIVHKTERRRAYPFPCAGSLMNQCPWSRQVSMAQLRGQWEIDTNQQPRSLSTEPPLPKYKCITVYLSAYSLNLFTYNYVIYGQDIETHKETCRKMQQFSSDFKHKQYETSPSML